MAVINAEKLVLGRMAAIAAKQALLGEDVKIINCEKAVIIGDRNNVIKHYLNRLDLGQPQQGPFIQRRPDLFVKRTIRGMLPRRKDRGRAALARVRCYAGIPQELAGKETALKKLATTKTKKDCITVGELCIHLGDNKR